MISGNRLLFALLVLLPVATHAQSDASLAAVMNGLAAVRSSSGSFTEEKYLSSLTEPLESKGTLAYRAPDHVEKITISPEPDSLIVTGDQLDVTRDGEVHSLALSDHPELQAFVESIRATLSGNLPALEQYYKVSFDGTPAKWRLMLQPTDVTVQQMVTSITIDGKGNRLTKVETLGANGDRSEMTIAP